MNSAVMLLEKTAARAPARVALDDENGCVSYDELRRMAMSVATGIMILRGDDISISPVMIYLPKSAKSVVGFMGAMYSGCPYAPMDIAIPADRLQKTLFNLSPSVILTDEKHAEVFASMDIAGATVAIYDELVKTKPDTTRVLERLDKVIDADPCYIMYTSGSTGAPKGVVVPHRGVLDYAEYIVNTYGIREDSVLGLQSGFHFDNSVFDIYSCMLTGAKLVIIPEALFMYPAKLPEFLAEKGVTCIFWVPTVMIAMANSGALDGASLPNLETVVFAGEVMPAKTLNAWRRALPHCLYSNLYGPTEITVDCTCYIVDREFDDLEPLPIGTDCANMRVLLLTEDGREAAEGEEGEICVIGSGVALGYWGERELSDRVFTQNPLNSDFNERMYRTGDIGRRNERGEILFVGRRDNQIKLRGNRVELGDIEQAARCIEGVVNACALFDSERERIVLFVESGSDYKPRLFNLELAKYVPRYMLPSELVVLDKLPLTPNRKIDRVLLKSMLKGEIIK